MIFKRIIKELLKAVLWFPAIACIWIFLLIILKTFCEYTGLIQYNSPYIEPYYVVKGKMVVHFLPYIITTIGFGLTYFVQFLFCLKYTDRKFRAFIENFGVWCYSGIITILLCVAFALNALPEDIMFYVGIVVSGIIYYIFKPKLIRSRETARNTQVK